MQVINAVEVNFQGGCTNDAINRLCQVQMQGRRSRAILNKGQRAGRFIKGGDQHAIRDDEFTHRSIALLL
ncbi:MAG: hypothetical protein HC915_13875 [Anaerolineae bacterium]|nr:hypothetical protein [Anaerolineae bacterium]